MPSPEPARYHRIIRAMAETPWAILPSTLDAIRELISLRTEGVVLSEEEIEARIAAGPGSRQPYSAGAVAVLPVYGTLVPRANLMTAVSGGTSLQQLGAAIDQAAADPSVGSILLDVNSPGGSVDLVPETAAKVRAARSRKRVVAVANTMAASAAYWIASQADELVVSPSGAVGSIGVLAVHDDLSGALEKEGIATTLISAGRYKTEANPFEPLGDEARTAIQAMVDDFYAMFVADVARGRGSSREAVRAGFGQGRMVLARAAVTEGMADRVETIEATLARLARGSRAPASASATAAGAIELEVVHAGHLIQTTPATAVEPQDQADERETELLARIRDTVVHTTTRLKEAR